MQSLLRHSIVIECTVGEDKTSSQASVFMVNSGSNSDCARVALLAFKYIDKPVVAEVCLLAVDPDHQCSGFGTMMLAFFDGYPENCDWRFVSADVTASIFFR